MDSYGFYKSLYDRELSRRKDLDDAIGLPITILTILVAANSYLIDKPANYQHIVVIISNVILSLALVAFAISVFLLTRSYNNLFKGFGYPNLGMTKEIREFETKKISDYNKQVKEDQKLDFENIIIDKLAQITDDHKIFNDQRSLDLYRARTFIIITLILTGIKYLIISINYI